MLHVTQFVASKSLDESGWLEARRTGVTATQIAKGATPSGRKEVLASYWSEFDIIDTPEMAFGRDSEPWLAMWAKEHYKTMPNDWLIRKDDDPIALATPDGLSVDHSFILEVKTTGKDWESVDKIPIAYKRQVQWQLYVTGAEYCVFVWLLRANVDGRMVPAWFAPKSDLIYRDENMIGELKDASRILWSEINGG
jgi:putative phage-type endonuclease